MRSADGLHIALVGLGFAGDVAHPSYRAVHSSHAVGVFDLGSRANRGHEQVPPLSPRLAPHQRKGHHQQHHCLVRAKRVREGGERRPYAAAIASISTPMPSGRLAAWMVVRAGGLVGKKVA